MKLMERNRDIQQHGGGVDAAQATDQQERHLAGWRRVTITGMRGQPIVSWRAVAITRCRHLPRRIGVLLPSHWTAERVEDWVSCTRWIVGFEDFDDGQVFYFR